MCGEERGHHNATGEEQREHKENQDINYIHHLLDNNDLHKKEMPKKEHQFNKRITHKPTHKAIYFAKQKTLLKTKNGKDDNPVKIITIPPIVNNKIETVKAFKNKKPRKKTIPSKYKQRKQSLLIHRQKQQLSLRKTQQKKKLRTESTLEDPTSKTPQKEVLEKKHTTSEVNPKKILQHQYSKNKQFLLSYTKRQKKAQSHRKRPANQHIKKQNKKVFSKTEPKTLIARQFSKNKQLLTSYRQRHKNKDTKKPQRKIVIKIKKPKIQPKHRKIAPKTFLLKKYQKNRELLINYQQKNQQIKENQAKQDKKIPKPKRNPLKSKMFAHYKKNTQTKTGYLEGQKEAKPKPQTQLQQKKKPKLHLGNTQELKKLVENELKEPMPTIQAYTLDEQGINNLKTQILHQQGFDSTAYEELDFYALKESFSYVSIVNHTLNNEKHYIIIEAQLDPTEEKNYTFLKETLSLITIDSEELEEKGQDAYLLEKIDDILKEYQINLKTQSKQKILYYLKKHLLGLGILEPVMTDPNIEDISCDGVNVPIFLYHREYGSIQSNIVFTDEEELASFVTKLAQKCGKHISIADPMLDATMPDGSRIQMTLSTEVTAKGSTFTIRKFKDDPFTSSDLIEFNTMNSEMIAYLWLSVEHGVNALIAGGTAAGKTSSLNAMSLFIPRDSKIVSIEETRELNLPHPNWIPGVARSGFGENAGGKTVGEIDLFDLMKAALRQRPEYLLVGEIRGREAYVLFQAMATGHTTYSTVHADSAQSLIHRLEGKPINIPRIMLQSLDVVCIQVISRVNNKRARRCKQIIEIVDIDPTTKEILTNEVFRWDPVEDTFLFTGKSYVLEKIRTKKGLSREDIIKELHNRSDVLEWMKTNDIRAFKEVATTITKYVEDPKGFLEKMHSNEREKPT